MDIEEAVLSDALVGIEGENTGDSIGDGHYEVVRTRYEFWNTLDESDSSSVSSSNDNSGSEAKLDSEGDFEIRRRPSCRDYVFIDHAMATTLSAVGLQVWHGALVLGDYILYRSDEVSEKIVLELGCGTGLTSICAALAGAKHVYATDCDQKALQLTHRNVVLNGHLLSTAQQQAIKARQLDWMKPGSKSTMHWSDADRENLRDASVILAADVIYDTYLNTALFNWIEQLCESCEKKQRVLLISLEKRYNFTLSHMDVACPAYEHFLAWVDKAKRKEWAVVKIDTNEIPVCFSYRRNSDMELWRLSSPGIQNSR